MKVKHVLIILATLLLVTSCQTSNNDNKLEGVVIDEQTNEISFSKSTNEAVELKFNFKKGDNVENVITSNMEIEMMGQKMPVQTTVEGKYEIKEVDSEGNATLCYVIKRITADIAAQGIKFDSNDKESRVSNEMAPLQKIVDIEIISKISAKGKVLSIDFSDVPSGEEHEILIASIKQNVQQFNLSSFVQLPENAVKAGFEYKGENTEQVVQGLPIKSSTSYKIKDISEDKTKVIIETEGKIDFDTTQLPTDITINMNSSQIKGWILIDLSRGVTLQSNTDATMDFSTSQMGQSFDMLVKGHSTMKVK